mmetsp:Transcript_93416/g.250205  ORF Transcript_93416/g.250205 Transcript_93416/m.250205 type:complete len:222 (-) Transcript_93416:1444-2109(-)
MRTSAWEYTARARATRAFCPPDRVTPFSPISVPSPPGSCSKSAVRAHPLITSAYKVSSKRLPNKMFSRTVAFKIHGDCAHKAMRPLRVMNPSTGARSPTMAWMSPDLPLPTGPMIAVRHPRPGISTLNFFSSSTRSLSAGAGHFRWHSWKITAGPPWRGAASGRSGRSAAIRKDTRRLQATRASAMLDRTFGNMVRGKRRMLKTATPTKATSGVIVPWMST